MCGASILCEIPCKAWEKTGRKTDSPYRPTLERTEQMIEVMLDLCVAGEAPGALRVHGRCPYHSLEWRKRHSIKTYVLHWGFRSKVKREERKYVP